MKKETIEKKAQSGKWGVTESRVEQEAEKAALQRRQFSLEMRAQVAQLTTVFISLSPHKSNYSFSLFFALSYRNIMLYLLHSVIRCRR